MAMDGNASGGGPRFSVGGVISAGLSAAFGNFFRFLAVILIVGVPVVLLLGLGIAAMGGVPSGAGTGIEVTIEGGGGAGQILFGLFALILGMLAYGLIQAALTFGTLQHLDGRVPAIRDCLAGGLQALPRVFLATLLLVVVFILVAAVAGMIFGGLLSGTGASGLIVVLLGAGILYVFAVFWVFVPAIVVERAGVLECFGRSMQLTKGRRWGIFAILVLIAVANGLVSMLTQLLAQAAPIAGTLIDLGVALFFLALGPVLATVGYYYLRAEKEGVAIDDVVRVFD